MAALNHSTVQSTVSRVDWTRWTESKAWKDSTVSWQGYGISILGCAWYYILRLPWKGPDYQQRVSHSVIGAFKPLNDEIKKKRPHLKKNKVRFFIKTTHRVTNQNDDKIAWMRLRIASPSTVFSRSGPQWLFSVCRPQKRYWSNIYGNSLLAHFSRTTVQTLPCEWLLEMIATGHDFWRIQ
jgi:hypothetical protein